MANPDSPLHEVHLDNSDAPSVQPPAGGPPPGAPPAGAPPAPKPRVFAGKFKSPEELESAYTELQSAYHRALAGRAPAPGAPPAVDPATGKPAAGQPARITQAAMARYGEEFNALGGLTEASYQELESFGIDRQVAHEILSTSSAGRQAAKAQARSTVVQIAGGEEQYREMQRWAVATLSPEERAAFNETLNSGDLAAASLAVHGVVSRWKAANAGPLAGQLQGDPVSGGGARPFGSMREMIEAQKDPKYKSDPGYRREVERRLAVSRL